MIIELFLMSTDELHFGVCSLKDIKNLHCLSLPLVLLLLCFWGWFLLLSSYFLYSITNLLTLKHRHFETSQQYSEKCPLTLAQDTDWRLIFSLMMVANPAAADGRGSAQVLQPRCSFPNCRPVLSTWRWYFRPVLLQLSRVDKHTVCIFEMKH